MPNAYRDVLLIGSAPVCPYLAAACFAAAAFGPSRMAVRSLWREEAPAVASTSAEDYHSEHYSLFVR